MTGSALSLVCSQCLQCCKASLDQAPAIQNPQLEMKAHLYEGIPPPPTKSGRIHCAAILPRMPQHPEKHLIPGRRQHQQLVSLLQPTTMNQSGSNTRPGGGKCVVKTICKIQSHCHRNGTLVRWPMAASSNKEPDYQLTVGTPPKYYKNH